MFRLRKTPPLGILFLFVMAMIVLQTIDRAFNQIWRVPRPRTTVQRVFIYWALLTVGPILIGASLSLTSWLVSYSLGLVKHVPLAGEALFNQAAARGEPAAAGDQRSMANVLRLG